MAFILRSDEVGLLYFLAFKQSSHLARRQMKGFASQDEVTLLYLRHLSKAFILRSDEAVLRYFLAHMV